jgi:hypothetical protein
MSIEQRWVDRGQPKDSEKKKPVALPLHLPQIPHGLTWAPTRSPAVRIRRLDARVMARPCKKTLKHADCYLRDVLFKTGRFTGDIRACLSVVSYHS